MLTLHVGEKGALLSACCNFFFLSFLFLGRGGIRGIQRVALAIVIPAGYWSFELAESQIAQRGAPENRPQGSR